jgi:hypothetical protein
VLAGEGIDPTTRLVMRHEGQDYDALRSTVGAAAGLTVHDTGTGKPTFGKYRPYSGPVSATVEPPMRETELAVP